MLVALSKIQTFVFSWTPLIYTVSTLSTPYLLYIYTISTSSTLYLHVQVSLPILIGGVLIARNMILPSFVIICLGMIFLNFNWSVSVDMTMWVTC